MMNSFIEVGAESHFPIQNLPFGAFRTTNRSPRIGIAIGDFVFDMKEAQDLGYFKDIDGLPAEVFSSSYLNAYMSTGRTVWSAVRQRCQELLGEESVEIRYNPELSSRLLVKMETVSMLMPVQIGDYTDFYASLEHATNVGSMFRGPENALNPNWKHLPVGYHGRSSSVVAGNGVVKRPSGQYLKDGVPVHGRTQKLDFELETAFFVGVGNSLGEPISIDQAEEHMFGMVLMNDWSARDIQKWEYVPLGPFLGKSFCTTISPWVVTMDALAPFRVSPPSQIPEPLSYLKSSTPVTFDIQLEMAIKPAEGTEFETVCRSNLKYLYWTMAQQLAHHSVNGCNLRTGDLLGSGTISGPSSESMGSLLELTHDGDRPLTLVNGVERTYLIDGDVVRMSGYAQGEGYRVGFGEIVNQIVG